MKQGCSVVSFEALQQTAKSAAVEEVVARPKTWTLEELITVSKVWIRNSQLNCISSLRIVMTFRFLVEN